MSNRYDDFGLFWEDVKEERRHEKFDPVTRPRPPVPNTGWHIPHSLPRLDAAKIIAVDIETNDPGLSSKEGGSSVRSGEGFICGLAIGTEDRQWYFPMRHEGGGNMDPEVVLRWARGELSRPEQPKVGMNLLYDLDWLAQEGVHVEGTCYDVGYAEALLDENKQGSYSLEQIGYAHGFFEGKQDLELYDWLARWLGGNPTRGQQARHIWRAPVELVGPYAESDVRLPVQIFERQRRLLEQDNLWELFMLETRLIPLMLSMKRRGVRIDRGKADTLAERLRARVIRDKKRLRDMVGADVDIWSADSLAYAFKRMGIEYKLTAKTKRPSFTRPWLENHPSDLAQLVMEIRRWEKFKGTFLDGYVSKHAVGGRIHTSFHQLKSDKGGTVSGRFSSSDPNLQNIPARDPELGKLIRSVFVPEEGHTWRKDDYSQIEYRLFVHFAFEVFKNDPDEHIRQAVLAVRDEYLNDPKTDYHVLCSNWSGLDRKPAKNLNFGVIYGMGLVTMCIQYGWSMEQAKQFMSLYDEHVPFARPLLQRASEVAESRGFIKTILGRKCRFELYEPKRRPKKKGHRWDPVPMEQAQEKWPDERLKRAMCYAALNRILQGSAADIMKKGMVDIWEAGICNIVGPPLLTVHDELDWSEPPTKEGRQALDEAQRIMASCVPLNIPVFVDSERGPSWGEVE